MLADVLVIGGGWAGCAAALAAARSGAYVTLAERTDMLLGTGLVGGIYRNNGRLTALLEARAMGCGQLFDVMDETARHRHVDFPGHRHAALYDVTKIERVVRSRLEEAGVRIAMQTRVTDVMVAEDRISAVRLENGESLGAGAFVEATGTAGGMSQCGHFGNGCAMCIIRCPTFGPRVSVAAKAGVLEVMGVRSEGRPGSMSGSCKLNKESLAPELVSELEANGAVLVPVPPELRQGGMEHKACQQYNLPAFKENLVILDTGHAKLMVSFYPLEQLRKISGLENARYADPYAGGVGNSIRYTSVTPRDNRLKAEGLENLFCAGEKAGFLVGHTEAVITGSLAGTNAAACSRGTGLLSLPDSLASGDIISYSNPARAGQKARVQRITFSGSVFLDRMKERGLYSTDEETVRQRVKKAGMLNIFRT